MFKLIKNVAVYTPDELGVNDILIAGKSIAKIAKHIDVKGLDIEVFDYKGKMAIPGLIDNHVHVCGGGGEASYQSRITDIDITQFQKAGITSVIGVLGTDGYTRSMENLIAKTKALNEQGMTAYALTGSYQVPVKTLTKSITDDLLFVKEIIGTGEIAVSDHRSSHPSHDAFVRLLSETHVAGLLSGKSGVTNIHIGGGKAGLTPLIDVLEKTDVPVSKIHPTHINRSKALLEAGIAYSKKYHATIDFTTYLGKEDDDLSASKAFKKALEKGVDLKNITFSSDGQGSLPIFDDDKRFIKMGIGQVQSLFESLRSVVLDENIDLTRALYPVTKNTARIFQLKQKGELRVGFDADIVIIDSDYQMVNSFYLGKAVKKTPLIF